MLPLAVPLALCMCIGSTLPWKRVLGTTADSDAYTSNTIFCGIKALLLSSVAHYLCVRHSVLGEEDAWYTETVEPATALGANFFLWEALDLAYCVYHRITTRDMVFHHVLHLLVAPVVMAFATPTWYYMGARLILQETSGIPLAVAVLFRHRAPSVARPAFLLFALAFFAYRIVNTGHLLLSMHRRETMLCITLLPAYLLQWWWFVKIVKRSRRAQKEM